MNTSFLNKSVMGILVLAALTLSACAKKEDSFGRTADRTGNGITQANQTVNCQNASQAWGKIYDQNNSANFETQVKAFVSATLDPNSLGSISGNINDATGVDFNGLFKFDSAGKLIPESSSITIRIFDSYVKQVIDGKTVQPYDVTFTQAKSGTINRNTRQINVLFEDEYGSITITGTYDGQIVQGTVAFRNSVAVTGYTPQSGTLGSFRNYQCAMIQ